MVGRIFSRSVGNLKPTFYFVWPKEMLNFLERDYPYYSWSLRSLDRQLRYFDIHYKDESVSVEEVRDAVAKLQGPGKLLGYRAMQKKIRQEHDLNVPRDLVHAVMYDIDPAGLEGRRLLAKRKKPKGHFMTKGTNWVHSVDGHDKLMGFQKSTYPLAVYGCIDTASRKFLWLSVWISNSDPLIIGRWYLEHLYEKRVVSSYMRMDKETETGVLATMHSFLRCHHGHIDPCETVIYGPSTSNQVSISINFGRLGVFYVVT